MAIRFQAAACTKSTEAPGGRSSRHAGCSIKRKKHSARHKKNRAFQCRKNTTGKGGKSETKVCCPLCKEMLADEDGLLDHFAQRLCPKDQCMQCTGTNLEANKSGVSQYSGESTLGNASPRVRSDGPVLASSDGPDLACIGLAARSDAPSACGRKKGITHSTYKLSYRMEADLEKVN